MTKDDVENKFPLGSRVKIINEEAEGGDFYENDLGYVRGYEYNDEYDEEEDRYYDSYRVLIEMDDYIIDCSGEEVGHNGEGQGKDGKCWYFCLDDIKLAGKTNVNSKILL